MKCAIIMPARDPGVAKFGIALEWGSRGLEFESRHSDQKQRLRFSANAVFIYRGGMRSTPPSKGKIPSLAAPNQ